MKAILYDLAGRDGLHFSPFCWRARLALAHKGVTPEIAPVFFREIKDIPAPSGTPWKTVPVFEHDGGMIVDSWDIAMHLEAQYPDQPTLFGGEAGVALCSFVKHWTELGVHRLFAGGMMLEVLECLDDGDKEYFRTTREARFGKSFEELQAQADAGIDAVRAALMPANRRLQDAPFLGGDAPLFADYILFASLQWARIVSRKEVIPEGLESLQEVRNWMERCLDLHHGMARSHRSRLERDQ